MATHVVLDSSLSQVEIPEQRDLFTNQAAEDARRAQEAADRERERKWQKAVLIIKKRYGKNAISQCICGT